MSYEAKQRVCVTTPAPAPLLPPSHPLAKRGSPASASIQTHRAAPRASCCKQHSIRRCRQPRSKTADACAARGCVLRAACCAVLQSNAHTPLRARRQLLDDGVRVVRLDAVQQRPGADAADAPAHSSRANRACYVQREERRGEDRLCCVHCCPRSLSCSCRPHSQRRQNACPPNAPSSR